MLEKIQRKKIINHLIENNLLSRNQYGFLAGRSTTLQLLHVMDEWTEALDEGKMIGVIYFDFKKAFDTVPYHRLLGKLKSYGISQNTLNWMKDFLLGRQQSSEIQSQWSILRLERRHQRHTPGQCHGASALCAVNQ